MDPPDDPSPQKFAFSKEAREDFAALMQEAEFLRRYASWWRAVFLALVVLIAIGLISWLICVNTEPDPRTWPWWILSPRAHIGAARSSLCGIVLFSPL